MDTQTNKQSDSLSLSSSVGALIPTKSDDLKTLSNSGALNTETNKHVGMSRGTSLCDNNSIVSISNPSLFYISRQLKENKISLQFVEFKKEKASDGLEYEYKYNKKKHFILFKLDKFKLVFELVPFKQEFGNFERLIFDTTKKYYHINRHMINYNKGYYGRKTQGMVYFSYLLDAVSTIASTVGLYYGWNIMKDVFSAVKATKGYGEEVIEFLKDNLLDIVFVVTIMFKVYNDKLSVAEGLGLVGIYFGARKIGPKILDYLQVFFTKSLVSAYSSFRHTQGGDISLPLGVISLIGAFIFGSDCSVRPENILKGIRSLGSTLLTVNTLDSIVTQVVEYLPDIIMLYISEMFPTWSLYTYIRTNKEFGLFINGINKLHNLSEYEILYNSHNLFEFLKWYNYLKKHVLVDNLLERGIGFLMEKYLDWFDIIYKLIEDNGLLPGRRFLPYVVWLSGDPGIGKSTFAKVLSKEFINTLFDGQILEEDYHKYIYAYNTANPYMDDYHNQPVFIINDYLQFTQQHEEQWLIRFADTIDVMLDPSTVDNNSLGVKGEVRFTSRIIIITSNITYLQSSNNIISVDALNRRRDLLLNLKWKHHNKKCLSDEDYENFDFGWVNFVSLQPIMWGGAVNNVNWSCSGDIILDKIFQNYKYFMIRQSQVNNTLCKDTSNNNTCKNIVLNNNSLKEKLNKFYNKSKDVVSDVLEFRLFSWYLGEKHINIRVKHILPICTVGSVAYIAYRSYVSTYVSKLTQSMSGDVSTRRFAPERKPLKRYTMGLTQGLDDMVSVVKNNMCKIYTTIKLSEDRIVGQMMNGIFIGGSLLVTPSHLWKRGEALVKDGDIVEITYKDVQYRINFDRDLLYIDEKRDLAVFNTLGYIPLSRDISRYLIDDNTYINNSGENAYLYINGNNSVLVPTKAYVTNAPYIDDFGRTFNGEDIWQYNVKTAQGDCGSPIFLVINGRVYLGGIHVAGDNYSGNAEILYRDWLDNIKFQKELGNRKVQGFSTDADYDDSEWFDATSDFDQGFVFLGACNKVPWQNDKTDIVKSPLFEVLQPHLTEPAVLSPSDDRLIEVVSPMIKSVSKYATHIKEFDNNLVEKAFFIVKSFYDILKLEEFNIFDYDDAINAKFTEYLEKLDLHTSAGYPWNIMKKSKKDLINMDDKGVYTIKQELRDKLNRYDKLLLNHTMFPYTLTTTLKDERVGLDKVKIGKTRTFMNFPVEYTILMRKYFDAFINMETKHALDIGTTVGVNIYSSKWKEIFNILNKYNYHLDGDFKAFDGTILPVFFRLYSRLVNSFYNDKFNYIRDMLVQGTCFSPIFVLNKVYMKLQGNPSGSRLTTSFNSFTNRMYVVMSLLEVLPETYHTIQFFKDNIKIFAHGDDHLIGFSSIVKNYWGGFELRDFMKAHNIDYTSSKKDQPLVDFCALQDCFYLKSHFVFIENDIRCGLSKDVIQEMVSWQRDFDLVSTQMIVNTALRYAYFWGYKYFDYIREKLLQACKLRKLNLNLLYYEDLENEYKYNKQLEFKYIN